MAFNNAETRPPDQRIPGLGAYDNVFYAGETITIPLLGTAGDTWKVRDYYGTVVASGSMVGITNSITLPSLGLGWYKVYFERATPLGYPFFDSAGELMVAVIRPGGPLHPRPPTNATAAKGDPIYNGFDIPMRGMCGVGPVRHQIRLDGSFAGDLAGVLLDIAYENSTRSADAARPHRQFVSFPNGYDQTITQQTTNLTQAVQQCVAAGVTWFEGLNEPTGDVAPGLAAFADAVHAASPSAKVMGPCPVIISGDYRVNSHNQGTYQVLSAVGSSRIDVISFHNYNNGQGDLATMRGVFNDFVTMLSALGMQSKPRFNTEFGSSMAAVYGSFEPRQQAKNTMLELHLSEQYAIPKEQTSIFYDRSHGFWDFPSFWICAEDHSAVTLA